MMSTREVYYRNLRKIENLVCSIEPSNVILSNEIMDLIFNYVNSLDKKEAEIRILEDNVKKFQIVQDDPLTYFLHIFSDIFRLAYENMHLPLHTRYGRSPYFVIIYKEEYYKVSADYWEYPSLQYLNVTVSEVDPFNATETEYVTKNTYIFSIAKLDKVEQDESSIELKDDLLSIFCQESSVEKNYIIEKELKPLIEKLKTYNVECDDIISVIKGLYEEKNKYII